MKASIKKKYILRWRVIKTMTKKGYYKLELIGRHDDVVSIGKQLESSTDLDIEFFDLSEHSFEATLRDSVANYIRQPGTEVNSIEVIIEIGYMLDASIESKDKGYPHDIQEKLDPVRKWLEKKYCEHFEVEEKDISYLEVTEILLQYHHAIWNYAPEPTPNETDVYDFLRASIKCFESAKNNKVEWDQAFKLVD